MIKIENIDLAYDQTLIKDGRLLLNEGQITVLSGNSGCGKTTLLYLVGLINTNWQCDYYFYDKKINLRAEQNNSLLRRYYISNILQEFDLLDDLRIDEALKSLSLLANQKYDPDEITNLLLQLDLDINLNTLIKNLSTGQKQRLNLLFALIKKPKLLILDEPTSALDKENTKLFIKILKEITIKNNLIVVIASHDQQIIDNGDVVYQIQDQQLKCLNHVNEVPSTLSYQNGSIIPFLKNYIINHLKSKQCMILLLTITLIINICIIFQTYFESIQNKQLENIILMGGNECLLTKSDNSKINNSELLKFKKQYRYLKAYPYTKIKTTLEDNTTVTLIPYFPEQDRFTDGFYATSKVYDKMKDKKFFTVNVYNKTIVINSLKNYQFSQDKIIYIDYKLIDEYLTDSQYLLIFSTPEDVLTLCNNTSYTSSPVLNNLDSLMHHYHSTGIYLNLILGLIYALSTVLSYIIQFQLLYHTQKRLTLFKVHGLSIKQSNLIHIIILFLQYLSITIISLFILSFFTNLLNSLLKICICLIITIIIPHIFIIYKLTNKKIIATIRN